MLNRKIMQLRSDEICQIEHSKPEATYLRRVKYKASKFQNFNFSVVVVAIMLMSTHALIQPNIEERLDLTGFKTITEQTATLARLMNAIFLQNHFQLGLVTMEDVITEVFDVSKSPLFNNINERDIRDTVRAMKDFDLLTTTPIDDRISWFDQFLPNGALTNISAVPELSSYANGKIDYNVCTTEYYDVERDMGILVAYTLHESNTSRDTAREFFPRFVNSTVLMAECLKKFHETCKNRLHSFELVRSQFEAVRSIVPNLKIFQKVANQSFLIKLTNQSKSLKLHTSILESWVNSSYRARIIRQASFMHDLLRKGGKTFDKKILIGLPNGSRDLAALAQDFKKEWLKQVLHDGESLDELETLLKPMKKFEMQLASIEKVSHKSARNNYLNCIRKFLKSIQGLDALKSTNISQTLPKAIDALENLSSVENYVSQFVVKFDELVNSCYTKFESLESELESFHLKKDDPYFFNKINNISSDYPLDGSKDEQLEHLDHLPYHEYLDDMKFTASSLLYFKQKENNITECIANISIFWKKFEEFRLSIELLFNSNVEDVTNVLRVIKTIVPFTGKERSSIRNVVDFLLAAKAKLSESKKLDADLQQEMKHVDVNRMLSFSNARDIASQFAYYHRTLVFYQKPEFLNFFHYFRSNGLELARKIDGLPYNEKKATGQVWQKMLEGNETEDELTIINFLKSVVVTEKFFSKNYSRPEGNLTSLAKVLIKLNGITVPVYNFMMMRESIEALKITSLGHSEQVSNAERSLAQLEGVHSSLAHTKYKIGNLLEEGDKFFDAFFTEKSHEDWATILLITAVVAYALVFIAVVILCCVYKWEFKIADVKQRK